jgi:diguanylate cyclase (GGDEF)-like protein
VRKIRGMNGVLARWRVFRASNAQVQGEATMESLRRFRGLACLMVPLHGLLAWVFSYYAAPAERPELAPWAAEVCRVQSVAAIAVLIAGVLTHALLRRSERAHAGAIVTQVLISGLYLYYGVHVTLLDLQFNAGAGLANYLLLCIIFGVLSLMRPALSVPVFALTCAVFVGLLEGTPIAATQRTSVLIIAVVAPALALVASWMNWSQYAKSVLLRRQLRRSNEALIAQQQELAFLADHDALTGLYNRREFMRLAEREMLRATRVPCETALIMVDLDYFKKINDRHGHPGGDAVLQAVAQRLGRALRSTDTLARLGGEEFIVLLPNTGSEGALQVAARLREAVRHAPVSFEDVDIPVTASLGVSSLRATDKGSVDAVYATADRALYVAKQLGRDRVEYAEPGASEFQSGA